MILFFFFCRFSYDEQNIRTSLESNPYITVKTWCDSYPKPSYQGDQIDSTTSSSLYITKSFDEKLYDHTKTYLKTYDEKLMAEKQNASEHRMEHPIYEENDTSYPPKEMRVGTLEGNTNEKYYVNVGHK